METDLQQTLDAQNLSPELTESLKKLVPGSYCVHRSWGFGKIKEWNAVLEQVVIDFHQKKGHSMQFQYAAESLTALSTDHILVRKAEDTEALKKQAQENPVEVVRAAINSLGTQATAENIQQALSPDIIPSADWKKWWEGAKRALKKDGHFYLPTKKSEALRILSAPNALGDQAVAKFREAIGAKAQIAALIDIDKFWPEIKSDALADEIIGAINQTLARIPKSQLALAIEVALSRDEFIAEAGRPAQTGPLSVITLTPLSPTPLSNLLDELPSAKQTKLLKSIQQSGGDAWPALFLGLLPRANARVAETVSTAFIEAGRGDEVVGAINRLIRERNVTCDLLFWICKNRPAQFQPLIEPQLFMAILSVLEKDQLAEIKKGTKLYELILSDKALVGEILKNAPFEDVRDITRAILLSPVFEELDKRSLLATIIKLYPDVQAMVVGEKSTEDAALIVSWESLQRRKSELEEIVTRKIPENSKEIGIARSYGDLRENHEFKAAKEMQTVLMRRKAELESMLVRAQGTDFANVDTSSVNIGTRVHLVDKSGNKSSFTILGAWDSDPVSGIISYLTPVAKALLDHKVGDTVQIPTDESGVRDVTIEKIESYK